MKKILSVVLCLLLAAGMFIGCGNSVKVDRKELVNISYTGAPRAVIGEPYIAHLSAKEGYTLPDDLTITMEGYDGYDFYIYNPVSGNLSIEQVTGKITIAADAIPGFAGTWKGTIDIAQRLNDMMAADPQMAGFFTVSGFTMDVTVEFGTNGVCKLTADQESARNAMEQALQQMSDSLISVLLQQLAASDEEMTLDEYLAANGTSVDGLMSKFFPESFAGAFDHLNFSLPYTVRKGKLHIAPNITASAADGPAQEFALEGNTLTIQAPADSTDQLLFPLTLQRVN